MKPRMYGLPGRATTTAFVVDPSTRSGLRVHIFRIEDAEKALEGMKNDE